MVWCVFLCFFGSGEFISDTIIAQRERANMQIYQREFERLANNWIAAATRFRVCHRNKIVSQCRTSAVIL